MTDAHNHLHQLSDPSRALRQAQEAGVTRMLINGTSEADWAIVAELARRQTPAVHLIPSFGLHPWEVPARSQHWLDTLRDFLQKNPRAALGECGLDRWQKPFDLPDQISCLQAQLDLAQELQRPLTIHCLQAWGPLLDLLQAQPALPPFLLHAYSGSEEMVTPFVELGGYFSFNGYFLHERKAAVRETFRQIPRHRLLLESDAPAMLPPAQNQIYPLPEEQNHPGNLASFLPPLADLLQIERAELAEILAANFQTFSKEISD